MVPETPSIRGLGSGLVAAGRRVADCPGSCKGCQETHAQAGPSTRTSDVSCPTDSGEGVMRMHGRAHVGAWYRFWGLPRALRPGSPGAPCYRARLPRLCCAQAGERPGSDCLSAAFAFAACLMAMTFCRARWCAAVPFEFRAAFLGAVTKSARCCSKGVFNSEHAVREEAP